MATSKTGADIATHIATSPDVSRKNLAAIQLLHRHDLIQKSITRL
jgi:hypothetical protein